MSNEEKNLNKFEYAKLLEVQNVLRSARSALKVYNDDKEWDWIQEEMDKLDQAYELIDEDLTKFLGDRYMLRFGKEFEYISQPELKVAWLVLDPGVDRWGVLSIE